ncbi:DUF2946 family protein [Sphingomonas sp. NCPPB 2930]
MQALRRTRHLTRLVLVWFALYVGAAIASALLAPQHFEMICSGSGMVKLMVKADNGEPSANVAAMKCPLCAPGGAPPPPAVSTWVRTAQPLAYAARSIPAAHIAALTAAPLPARGPPAHF